MRHSGGGRTRARRRRRPALPRLEGVRGQRARHPRADHGGGARGAAVRRAPGGGGRRWPACGHGSPCRGRPRRAWSGWRRHAARSGSPARLPAADRSVVELQAPSNIAVGPVPWGFGPWPQAEASGRSRSRPGRTAGTRGRRTLVIVVRDAHRYAGHRALVSTLLSARPDATRRDGAAGVAPGDRRVLATYGATRANAQAAAELLGV